MSGMLNSGARPKAAKEDECRIVITDCDGADDQGNRRVAAWLGQDASSPLAMQEGELSRSDSQPRRHHKHHHRRHHKHHHRRSQSRSSQSEEPSASRCQSSRLVVEEDFASDCETVATTRSEAAWSVAVVPKDDRKRRKKRKRKRKPEAGGGGEGEEDDNSEEGAKRDKKAEMIVVTVSAVILTIALLLIGITLALTPKIDEMVIGELGHVIDLHDLDACALAGFSVHSSAT
ncbi:hypothetical protein HPB48_004777 [Haemaphysalis longicornis]|uniref:Uncharacterized protein n=1 Tax=Haemaphysalis longicornis TaxID=44386 RepID=A0A9J6FR92_HAELO|nr:hypothetical protein HPB48_004777 [Haemaphysalis longicornis]